MSKQITPNDLAEIVTRLLTDPNEIDDHDVFGTFFLSIAEVVCSFCGGEPDTPDANVGEWLVGITANDSLPPNGGIWANYDKDEEF